MKSKKYKFELYQFEMRAKPNDRHCFVYLYRHTLFTMSKHRRPPKFSAQGVYALAGRRHLVLKK